MVSGRIRCLDRKVEAPFLDEFDFKACLSFEDQHIGPNIGSSTTGTSNRRVVAVDMGWERMERAANILTSGSHFGLGNFERASDFMKLVATQLLQMPLNYHTSLEMR